MINQDLTVLLTASIELAKLRNENRQLRKDLAAEREARIQFEMSADSRPALLRPQA